MLLAALIPDWFKRQLIAKAMRWAGTAVGAGAAGWLLAQNVDAATAHKIQLDILQLFTDASPLVLPLFMLYFGQKNVTTVAKQMVNVRNTAATTVAAAARVGNGRAAQATAEAIHKGEIVIVGEPSNVSKEREMAVTAALNKAQLFTSVARKMESER